MSRSIEQFKVLCCLGLPAGQALTAVASAVREVIPASWTRIGLFDEHGAVTAAYAENGDFPALAVARYDHFARLEPLSIAALMLPAWRAAGVGWTLHRQNAKYLNSGYYDEIEKPCDACWLLDAFVHDGTRSIVGLTLARPRSAAPFRSDDVALLDSLRPWIAHAFRDRVAQVPVDHENGAPEPVAGDSLQTATVVVDASGKILFRTRGAAQLLMMLSGSLERIGTGSGQSLSADAPGAVQRVVRDLMGAIRGNGLAPPRTHVRTVWGTVALEASWLAPTWTSAADLFENHDQMKIAVNMELREHGFVYAARVLRARGASPVQVRIGVLLASGKTKPQISQELGIKPSSVMDATRKLYSRMEVRNSAELGMRLWASGPSRHDRMT